jgi:general nucleoside transport system permease protein
MTAIGDFLGLALSSLTPILIAALASKYAVRSGATNIAIDGMMLLSALAALSFAYATGNPWVGLLAAISAGVICALLLALVAFGLQSNLVIAGIAFNLLAVGLSFLILQSVLGAAGNFSPFGIALIPRIELAWLEGVPILGEMFRRQSALVYVVIGVTVAISLVVDRSAFAVRVRAVGEAEEAAEAVGVRIWLIRTVALAISGAGAGVAGAYLTLSSVGSFNPGLTGGLGFIAFSAVIFGRATSQGIILASVLFTTFGALVIYLQGVRLFSYQLLQALPYITTIFALAFHGFHRLRGERFETTETTSMPVIVPRG